MLITDIYDAAREGNFDELKLYYQGNINLINESTKMNLLQTVICGKHNYKERLEIIDFLLSEGIDVNYLEVKEQMNALHLLYSSVTNKDVEYLYAVSKKLIEKGIKINQKDRYGAVALSYLISGKLGTEELRSLFEYLLDKGVDYNLKDKYGNSCLDYARQFPWRKGFVDMVEVYNDK